MKTLTEESEKSRNKTFYNPSQRKKRADDSLMDPSFNESCPLLAESMRQNKFRL